MDHLWKSYGKMRLNSSKVMGTSFFPFPQLFTIGPFSITLFWFPKVVWNQQSMRLGKGSASPWMSLLMRSRPFSFSISSFIFSSSSSHIFSCSISVEPRLSCPHLALSLSSSSLTLALAHSISRLGSTSAIFLEFPLPLPLSCPQYSSQSWLQAMTSLFRAQTMNLLDFSVTLPKEYISWYDCRSPFIVRNFVWQYSSGLGGVSLGVYIVVYIVVYITIDLCCGLILLSQSCKSY